MPSVERSASIVADVHALRRTLAAVDRWPQWCALFRSVAPATSEDGPGQEDAWSIVALLGSMPFSAFARLSVSAEGDQVALATLTSASPVDYARYTFTIAGDTSHAPDAPSEGPLDITVTMRVDYGFGRGPGGWLIERLLVRRRIPAQLEAALHALAGVAGERAAVV